MKILMIVLFVLIQLSSFGQGAWKTIFPNELRQTVGITIGSVQQVYDRPQDNISNDILEGGIDYNLYLSFNAYLEFHTGVGLNFFSFEQRDYTVGISRYGEGSNFHHLDKITFRELLIPLKLKTNFSAAKNHGYFDAGFILASNLHGGVKSDEYFGDNLFREDVLFRHVEPIIAYLGGSLGMHFSINDQDFLIEGAFKYSMNRIMNANYYAPRSDEFNNFKLYAFNFKIAYQFHHFKTIN